MFVETSMADRLKMSPTQLNRGIVASDSVRDINEDLGFVRPTMAWVLDGATGITDTNYTPGRTDGEWYVETFSSELLKRIHEFDTSLTTIIRNALDSVSRQFNEHAPERQVDPAAEPSATGAIVRWTGTKLEYFVLCDSTLLFYRDGEVVENITDKRITQLEERALNQIESKRNEGLSHQKAREESFPLLRENRRAKNTEGNYWVFSMDTSAIEQAITGTFDIKPGDEIYLFTDGVDRLVETYNEFENWQTGIEYLQDKSETEVFNLLRRVEKHDRKVNEYPRTKWADDATLVRLEFERGSN